MNNEFSYKGYSGSCEASIEDECLVGRILFIDDLIVYEGETVAALRSAFEAAVERYLEHCAKTGKPANKPYSGNFNVRVSNAAHKEAAQCAQRDRISLNQFVARALDNEIKRVSHPEVIHHELTVNHVITHEQKSVELPYEVKETSWRQSPAKPRLQLVN